MFFGCATCNLPFYTFAHTIAPKIMNKLLLAKIFLSRLKKTTIFRLTWTIASMVARMIKTKPKAIVFCGLTMFNTAPFVVKGWGIK